MEDGGNKTTIPAPFVFAPSQAWDGNDGSWSTFTIRVGTPEQNFRVLPSTMGNEIFIPVTEGCIESDPLDCGSLRGVYPFEGEASSGFQPTKSSSWEMIALYNLALETELNYTGNGMYGYDTVGLQIQNSGGLTLKKQVIAGIATKDFYLGLFGLSPKPSNFSDFDHPQPSYMRTLKDQNMIPSLSYAYTAGASYRVPKLPGSLVLGGYDRSRFTTSTNTVEFPFDADDSRVLSLGLQSITSTNTLQGTVSLLGPPIFSLVDSTVPEIWLPRTACDEFETAFGLAFDNTTGRYLVNSTIHSQLTRLNPTLTFALGNSPDPSSLVNINLPYSAFDLEISHPIYPNSSQSYFPIRRAEKSDQYRLGRTFLQEAYIIADYERANFSIHQARFQSPMPPEQIVPILSPSNNSATSNPSPTPKSSTTKLSTATIAGIVVGAVLAIVILLGILIFLRRLKQRRKVAELQDTSQPPGPFKGEEMPDEGRHEMYQTPGEMYGSKVQYELPAPDRHLLSDDHGATAELPGKKGDLSGRGPSELADTAISNTEDRRISKGEAGVQNALAEKERARWDRK